MASKNYPFTRDFQLAIMRELVADPVLMPKLAAYLKAEKFDDANIAMVIGATLGYYKTQGAVPTTVAVVQELRRQVEGGKLTYDRLSDANALFDEAEDQPPAARDYILERVFDEERKAALYAALDNGFKLYRQGEYDEVIAGVEAAAAVGRVDASLGVDFRASQETRLSARKEGKQPPRWGTGIVDLDDCIRGGLAQGELGCILGAPKYGKSMMLAYITLHTMRQGGTVVYYSLEMSEQDLIDRLDAGVARVPTADLSRQADLVAERVATFMAGTGGTVVVKQFVAGATTSRDLRSHLSQLRVERSIVPTVVVVDYGDLLSAATGDHEKRYEELGRVYEELRALGQEFSVPVWTASQAKREALSKKVVSGIDIAESFKKLAVVDVMVAICRTEEERADRLLRLYLSQCRYAADGVTLGPFRTAFEHGLIVDDGGASSLRGSDE
jgi:archaellum biogenesis ATPase FlaH